MREILFRGKRLGSGEWIEGYLIVSDERNFISSHPECLTSFYYMDGYSFSGFVEVDPSTVGQYTGLVDKNGKRIFEGDIVKSDNGLISCTWVVRYGEYTPTTFYELVERFCGNKPGVPSFGLYGDVIGSDSHVIITKNRWLEVIGNIHDNPELLKEA